MFKRLALPLGLILGFTTACVTRSTETTPVEDVSIVSEFNTIDTLGMNASDSDYLQMVNEI